MNRDESNEYDLGLPVPIAALEQHRRGVRASVWDRVFLAKAQLVELLGPKLHEVASLAPTRAISSTTSPTSTSSC